MLEERYVDAETMANIAPGRPGDSEGSDALGLRILYFRDVALNQLEPSGQFFVCDPSLVDAVVHAGLPLETAPHETRTLK